MRSSSFSCSFLSLWCCPLCCSRIFSASQWQSHRINTLMWEVWQHRTGALVVAMLEQLTPSLVSFSRLSVMFESVVGVCGVARFSPMFWLCGGHVATFPANAKMFTAFWQMPKQHILKTSGQVWPSPTKSNLGQLRRGRLFCRFVFLCHLCLWGCFLWQVQSGSVLPCRHNDVAMNLSWRNPREFCGFVLVLSERNLTDSWTFENIWKFSTALQVQ